jgi:hypothetical protein
MFSNQLVNHFIDTFSTNAVLPVVGWVEAIAETHYFRRYPYAGYVGFFAGIWPVDSRMSLAT